MWLWNSTCLRIQRARRKSEEVKGGTAGHAKQTGTPKQNLWRNKIVSLLTLADGWGKGCLQEAATWRNHKFQTVAFISLYPFQVRNNLKAIKQIYIKGKWSQFINITFLNAHFFLFLTQRESICLYSLWLLIEWWKF